MMDISKLKRDFEEKMRSMSDEEFEEFAEFWAERGCSLLKFYGIGKELKTDEERWRFLDYLYMYAIAYGKEVFDERYDQPLFNAAFRYAKGGAV